MPFARPSKDEARTQLAALVDEYIADRSTFEAAGGYPESQARLDFIDKMLRLFGWDVSNDGQRPHSQRDVVVEPSTDLDDNSLGRPDYSLRHDGKGRHVVEAKKPGVTLATNGAAARQARIYGWSLGLPVAVLTNFREIVFYDARVEPQAGDDAAVAEMPGCRFLCEDYVQNFDRLWELLSYETVISGRYDETYQYVEPPRGTSDFDRAFLSHLRSWRLVLAADILDNNPTLGVDEVARRVQRVLNALLFLRVCEDRRISQYEDLLKAAKDDQVLATFRRADAAFNAGLFDVLSDTTVSITALREVIDSLYWPRSKYAFGVIQPDILAAVYEQFLAERVELDPSDGQPRLVEKPEISHTGGIVPTPYAIVDSLLRDSLLQRIQDLTCEAAESIKLVDMSCGSGIFLVRAYETLLTWFEEHCGPQDITERGDLVLRHIHGVDIDPEAIEVTRFSLLLAVLGEERFDPSTVAHVLPDLSSNLRIGNAVVGPEFDRNFPAVARDLARRAKVKPFSWNQAFPSVFPSGNPGEGFDVVVGNPPYARIQVLSEHLEDHLTFLKDSKSGFRTGHSFNFDLSMVFIERGLQLLAAGGVLAMVVPNRFVRSSATTELRALLAGSLERMVDFGDQQVFPGRSTYTCLLFARPQVSEDLTVERVTDYEAWRDAGTSDVVKVDRQSLGEEPWLLDDPAALKRIQDLLGAAPQRLKDVAEVFVGVQTSADDIFFVEPANSLPGGCLAVLRRGRTSEVTIKDKNGKKWNIEPGILRAGLKDRSLEPYGIDPLSDRLLLFPYTIERKGKRDRAVPLSLTDMSTQYPKALKYFEHFEDELTSRSMQLPNAMSDRFWAFGRSQSLTKVQSEKIIVRTLSVIPQYVYDRAGLIPAGGGDGGPYTCIRSLDTCPYPVEVLIALLSHPTIDSMVAMQGKFYRGGYFPHRKATLEELPVPTFGKDAVASIVEAVQEIHQNLESLRGESDSQIIETIRSRNEYLRGSIESQVGEALGLDDAD